MIPIVGKKYKLNHEYRELIVECVHYTSSYNCFTAKVVSDAGGISQYKIGDIHEVGLADDWDNWILLDEYETNYEPNIWKNLENKLKQIVL